jgi:hypothetical protein
MKEWHDRLGFKTCPMADTSLALMIWRPTSLASGAPTAAWPSLDCHEVIGKPLQLENDA